MIRFATLFALLLALGAGAWFSQAPTDACASDCGGEASVEVEVEVAEAGADCDDGKTCPADENNGCDDCETCTCCAPPAPAATVLVLEANHEEPAPIPGGSVSTHPGLRACSGFVPGVFKPPRA